MTIRGGPEKVRFTYLESLQVNRKDRNEECVDKEPMGDENDNSENTKLSNSAPCEDSDDAKDSVASHHFKGIGGPRNAHTSADALLDWQCDRSRNDFIDLKPDEWNLRRMKVLRTNRNMFSAPMNTT